MKTLFISGDVFVSRKDNTIAVKIDKKRKSIPLENVDHIVLTSYDGEMTVPFILLCGQKGIRLSFMDYYGWYKGSFEPATKSRSGEIKIRQMKAALDDKIRMFIAKEIIKTTTSNMCGNLQYYANKSKNADLKKAIQDIKNFSKIIDTAQNTEKLMGYEGTIKRKYYEVWKLIDLRLDFGARIKRPPNNEINMMISFINGIIYAIYAHTTYIHTNLDLYIPYLHSPSSGRYSLSLDLSETFKPIITDRIIFKIIRKNMLNDKWFDKSSDHICLLTDLGRRELNTIVNSYIEKKNSDGLSLKEHMAQQSMSLQRMLLNIGFFKAYKNGE